MEVPWFAEWFIHLSLLAVQARGIPLSAPTNALFLLYLAARTERGRHEGLVVCLPSHPQKHPFGSALGGVVPGDDAGGGGRPDVASEKPHLTIVDLFKMPQESDCSGLKCCLCCLLVVWPQANGLTSLILEFFICYEGIITPISPLSGEGRLLKAPDT